MAFIIGNNNELFPNGSGSHLLWHNEFGEGSVFDIFSSAINSYDIPYMFDYLSTTVFTPDISVNAVDYVLNVFGISNSSSVFNCIAMSGVNLVSARVDNIEIRSGIELIATYYVNEVEDDQPIMILFEPILASDLQIIFNSSSTLDELRITNLYAGRTIEFPGQPDVGYQPGKWNNKRETKSFKSQNNAFGRSVTVERGTEEIVNFSLLPIEFMDTDYKPFIQTHAGWPVFFAWDLANYNDEVIFGQVKKGKSTFNTGVHSSVGLTFTGNI